MMLKLFRKKNRSILALSVKGREEEFLSRLEKVFTECITSHSGAITKKGDVMSVGNFSIVPYCSELSLYFQGKVCYKGSVVVESKDGVVMRDLIDKMLTRLNTIYDNEEKHLKGLWKELEDFERGLL